MNTKNEIEIFYPKSKAVWRRWLQKNHLSKQAVFYNKASTQATINWSDAVDEALCFGWIDSKKISIDPITSHQFFSKRKAKSTWSKINKNKIERLIADGLMADAGLLAVETAKQNGCWIMLDDVEELVIPKDLAKAFKSKAGSKAYFLSLSKSARKSILQWLVLAKRPETREKRITAIATLAAQKLKPKQF
jgi:uncharacterized protein YdeI (YjbR/CyaY-like superfamily)